MSDTLTEDPVDIDGRFESVNFTDAIDLIEAIVGKKPKRVEEYDLTLIDPAERVQVRLDKNNAPKEMIEKYASQMSFSKFPPIVVTEDNRLVDGNSRVGARRKREERFCTAFVVPVSWDNADAEQRVQLQYLGLALNNSNGKALDRAERRRMVRDAIDLGMSNKQIAATVGFPATVISSIRHEVNAEEKLQRVGLVTETDSVDVRDATLRALGKASDLNDPTFKEVAVLAIDAGFSAGEVKALATSVRDTGSDELGLDRISREREANAQRIADRKRGGDGHPPASRQLRQKLGYVVSKESSALVETNREQMPDHIEMIEQTLGILQDVLEAQRKLLTETAAA